jgi:hypothetical protein
MDVDSKGDDDSIKEERSRPERRISSEASKTAGAANIIITAAGHIIRQKALSMSSKPGPNANANKATRSHHFRPRGDRVLQQPLVPFR